MHRTLPLILLTFIALVTAAPIAQASPITTPSGLNPGDTYHLAFVTAGTRDATSSNIADYDSFVTTEANLDPSLAALGTTWKAIGSTETVSAVNHIGVTGPVYNLQGQLVAASSADMFDGTLAAPIQFDQHGSLTIRFVWTGSTLSGTSNPPLALGDNSAELGESDSTDFRWIAVTNLQTFNGIHESMYGISGPLLASAAAPDPAAVPEPGTISLMLGPLLLLRRTYRRCR